MPDDAPLTSVRLDVWLDVACLFKTRSEAQKACNGGKVELNDQRAKPHRVIRVGDRLKVTRGPGRKQLLVVARLGEHHVPRADARLLYEDVSPPPTPEEVAARELERSFWKSRPPAVRTPSRREQRERRLAKEHGL
jgi:ribosome-associated heat shock protein Hsp15